MYKIPEFITAHSYLIKNNKKSLIYIYNYKTKEFIILDEDAAILYNFFKKSHTHKEIIDFASTKNFQDEIDDFLKELIDIGLLTDTGLKTKTFINSNSIKVTNIEEDNNFRKEMSAFMEANNYMERLFLELTYNCNLNCIHCYNDKTKKNQYMKFNDIKKIIDEAEKLGCFFITMSGGECTLNPDLLQIIKYIRRKRIAFELYTNGQILYENKQLLMDIINLYPYRIGLSLYSMNSQIHDKITGVVGSQIKTLNVIKTLKENNINVEIKCFLTKLNAYEYKEVEKFAKNNNFNLTLDYSLLSNPSKNNNDIKITPEQMLDLHTDRNSVFFINNIKPHNINKCFYNERICNGGSTGLLINPDLNVYICPSLKISMGSLRENTLNNIWNDKKPLSNLNKFKALKKADLKDCYKNEYCKFCVYCPGVAFMSNSYLKQYKNYCEAAKIRIKAADIIKNEENI